MEEARLQGEGYANLCKIFSSADCWAAMSRHFKQEKCVDRVLAYADEERQELSKACRKFVRYHDWRYMATPPAERTVLKVLAAAAYTICKASGSSQEDRILASEVGTAAKNGDRGRIRGWLKTHYRWIRADEGDDFVDQIKRVVAKVAAFFEPSIQDFWSI